MEKIFDFYKKVKCENGLIIDKSNNNVLFQDGPISRIFLPKKIETELLYSGIDTISKLIFVSNSLLQYYDLSTEEINNLYDLFEKFLFNNSLKKETEEAEVGQILYDSKLDETDNLYNDTENSNCFLKQRLEIGRQVYSYELLIEEAIKKYNCDEKVIKECLDEYVTINNLPPMESELEVEKFTISDKVIDSRADGFEIRSQALITSEDTLNDNKNADGRYKLEFTPLSSLKLSRRSYNALLKSNINSVETLKELSKDELLSIRNLGKGSVEEILNVLGKSDKCPISFRDPQDVKIKQLSFSNRTTHALVRSGILTLEQLCKYNERSLFLISGLGQNSVNEIISFF